MTKRSYIMINEKGRIYMATQIASTPILYGIEAEKALMEAKSKPTRKSKENGKKLINFFKLIVSEDE